MAIAGERGDQRLAVGPGRVVPRGPVAAAGPAGPVGPAPAGPDGAAPPAVAGGAAQRARRYGDNRLTNWLASFWANAWPNTE